ncbi:MAG: T9SS type A sorting domain-containing protein, partial [Bacteroidetes bacterium]|nr:T9SS type A sorting domain-containing protein [Bacteroidota bacterium]
ADDNYLNSIFFASYDFGETWSALSSNLSTKWIIVDWNNNKRIYLFEYPMRSEDGGYNWTYPFDGKPGLNAMYRSIIDPNNSSVLYASTNAGIYRITDFGEQWILMQGSESLDLSSFSSGDYPEHLFIDSTTKKLYVGTSQGLYKYDLLTSVEAEKENLPNKFVLYQNYPNPFNPGTVISYQLPSAGFVELIVYDQLGRAVKTIINEEQESGFYKYNFNSKGLSSGVYYYRLVVYSSVSSVGSFVDTKKMLFLK